MSGPTVLSMANFGDSRTRDVYHRNSYASAKAASNAAAVSIDSTFYGITADDSTNALGAAAQYELVKMQAVESSADSTAARLDISINGSASSATAGVKVAELSATNAKFVAQTLSGDFGSSYTAAFTKGLAQDGTTAAVTQTFSTGASGTAVALAASSDRLFIQSANTDLSGEMTLQGDRLNWAKSNAGVAKKAAANVEYVYAHNAGTVGTSTGDMNFNLDPLNFSDLQMASGAFQFNSFNAAGASETVLAMGAGAAAGAQTVQFSNSSVGIGIAPTNGFKLDVVGNSRVDGNITVTGDLLVSGTTTTIDTATVQVEDANISMAYNVTDPAIFNGGGITVGSGASAATLDYNNTLVAWDANIGINIPTAKAITVAGGYDTTTDLGVTLSESGLYFGKDTAEIVLGTGAVLNASGFTSLSDATAVTFGANKEWAIVIEEVSGVKYLSFKYSTDSGATRSTKFSISP
jgi:hypothetical protein